MLDPAHPISSAPRANAAHVKAPADEPFLPAWGITLVLALTFAIYLPTLRYQFVHDDRGQIVENPAVHSWRAVPGYFTSQVWAGVMPEKLGNYYRPVFLLWLRLNHAIFGSHAWGWHLTTVLVHVLATFLVYLLSWQLASKRDVALLAALIFGLHPAHIEAVAWISGVTEPLLGALFIGSLLAYIHSRQAGAGRMRWRTASLGLFALAMLEKETALILPAILLLYEWFYRNEAVKAREAGGRSSGPGAPPFSESSGRADSGIWAAGAGGLHGIMAWGRAAMRETWPYFALLACYVPARIHALKGFNHNVTPLSTVQLLFTWPALIAFWIRHLVWPAHLATFYNFPAVTRPTLGNFTLPALFDLSVGAALYLLVRRSRAAMFFAAWLVLPLIPLLNLRVFVANDFAHDRYLYLPSAGFAVLAAMLLEKISWGPKLLGKPAFLPGVAVFLAAVLGYGTITQSSYFRDNLTFYSYNLVNAPHNPDAESNYASVLAESGQYDRAIAAFLDAVRYNPTYWTPAYNLALTFYKTGNLPEAEKYFLRAIQINPSNPDEYFYLGMVRFKTGRTPGAIACLQQAIALNPEGNIYHFALGMMLKTQGNLNGALEEMKLELANNPTQDSARRQADEIEKQLEHPTEGKP